MAKRASNCFLLEQSWLELSPRERTRRLPRARRRPGLSALGGGGPRGCRGARATDRFGLARRFLEVSARPAGIDTAPAPAGCRLGRLEARGRKLLATDRRRQAHSINRQWR